MKKLLLVEDDFNILDPLRIYLINEGFEVETANSLAEAQVKLKEERPDLIILDWNLPDGQGIDLLKQDFCVGLPVILLTARQDLIDKVVGLELGANDYMTKPFEPRELLARIRVQIRSRLKSIAHPSNALIIDLNGITMNLNERSVHWNQAPIELTKKEFELLKLFVENPNKVFSRDELLNLVWGYEEYPNTRTVDNHILKLRQLFPEEFFETVRGVGYRFKRVS